MAKPGESFRDFELGGWEDEGVCSDYDEHLSTVTIQSVGALLDAAGVREGRRVLDVATGAGCAAAMAAARGAEAIGVDFSASQLSMARNRYPAARFEQADADSLPFPSESFDAVVSGFGMCHFADPDKAAREAFRVPETGWSLWVYGLGCARECGGHWCDLRRRSSSRLARRWFARGAEFLSVQRSGTQQAGRH